MVVASHAASLESAEVTAAINQVILTDPGSPPRPAAVGAILRGKATLETGAKSRAELTFNDRSLARLGANSLFAFSKGTREMELNRGVILMQVPKGAGGATIQTAAVTAAITGTTIFVEYSPADPHSPGAIKIFVLEGSLRLSLKGSLGESLLLEPGQMIVMEPGDTKLPDPQVFDIERMVKTSGLLSTKQFSEIPSQGLIIDNILLQNAEKRRGRLLISNFTLRSKHPGGIQNFSVTSQNTALREIARPPQKPQKAPQTKPPAPVAPPPTPPPPAVVDPYSTSGL